MSDVFLSYKREDAQRVALLADGLKRNGLSVWWDQSIAGGDRWRQAILEELEAARCVVVFWTEASAGPQGEFVHEEAARAKARGVLLPVRLDPVEPPLGFGEIQCLDLVGWRGRLGDRRFRSLVAAVKARVQGKPQPVQGRATRKLRWVAAWATGSALAAGALGLAADLAELEDWICRVPGIRGACASLGLGGLPSEAEAALWRELEPKGCEGLRTYLARYPEGAFAAPAQSRLQARTFEKADVWAPKTQPLPLTVLRGDKPLATEQAARADALVRAQEEATAHCARFASDWYRVLGASAAATRWSCLPRDSGFVCGFDGEAICRLEARRTAERELCP